MRRIAQILILLATAVSAFAAASTDSALPIYPDPSQFSFTARRLRLLVVQTNYTLVGGTNISIDQVVSGTNVTITVNSSGDNLWINNSGILQPKDLTLPVRIDSQIRWGPGSTNALYKRTNMLGYDNVLTFRSDGGQQYSVIGVEATDGGAGIIAGYRNGTYGGVQIIGKDFAQIGIGTSNIKIDSQGVSPNSGGTMPLAGHDVPFGNAYFSNTVQIIGFLSGSGSDYSDLAISHGGTNSVILFDSQSSGTAGPSRDILFSFNNRPYNGLDIGEGLTYQQRNSIGSVVPIGVYGFLANSTTAATSSQQQNSPGYSYTGSGWSTNLNAAESTAFASYITPKSGGAHPTSILNFYHNEGVSGDPGTSGLSFGIYSDGPVRIPSITKAQKAAILAPENGVLVYQTDNTPGFRAYVNGTWFILSTAADP